MLNKIKLYGSIAITLLLSIFFYGKQKKKEGEKNEQRKAKESELEQRRKNYALTRKVNKMTREELENEVIKK